MCICLTALNGVFPNSRRIFIEFSKFMESDKSLMHELAQFKDFVSHMCLAGTMVTQEVAGLVLLL